MSLRKRSKKSLNHTKRSVSKRQKVDVQESSEEVAEFVVEAIWDHRINPKTKEI